MITRSRFLKMAGVGAVGSTAIGAAVHGARGASSRTASLTKEYVRSADPALRVRYPDDWAVHETWGEEMYVNPLPLVALTNRAGGIPTPNENPVPSPRDLTSSDLLLTVYGVPIEPGETYLPATSSVAGVSSGAVPTPSGVGGVSLLADWLIRPDGRWGYLVYGYVGDDAPAGATTMQAVLSSVQFN